MTLKEFIKATNQVDATEFYGIDRDMFPCLRPHAICADGYIISIQASAAHYCWPRENFLDEYEEYEVLPISKEQNFDGLKKLAKTKKQKEALEWFRDMYHMPDISVKHAMLETFLNLHGGIKEIRNMSETMRRFLG